VRKGHAKGAVESLFFVKRGHRGLRYSEA
jgi:hypothetical protein